MATISITRKIQFNKNDAKKIAQACNDVEKLTINENPHKITKREFLSRIKNK